MSTGSATFQKTARIHICDGLRTWHGKARPGQTLIACKNFLVKPLGPLVSLPSFGYEQVGRISRVCQTQTQHSAVAVEMIQWFY